MFLGLSATTAEMDCCHNWKHMLFQVEFCNALGLVLICTALGLLHCDAVQVTMNMKDILFIEIIGPIWRGGLPVLSFRCHTLIQPLLHTHQALL